MWESDKYIDGTGQRISVHARKNCSGTCAIHCPSDHHMKHWPTHWRDDRKLMERICPEHGVGHPDPDHMTYVVATFDSQAAKYEGMHGCCGCCAPPEKD